MKKNNLKLSFNSARTAAGTDTIKDTGIVFTGNLIGALLGAVFYFLLARFSGPAGLGVYAIVIAIVITAADLFDIALNATIINYASRKELRATALRLAFKRKILLMTVMTVFLWLAAPRILLILNKPELLDLLRIGVWLVPAKALFSFVRSGLQAARSFVWDAGMDVFSSVLRLGIFWWGVTVFMGDPIYIGLVSYFISLILTAILAFGKVWKLMSSEETKGVLTGFSGYQSWMTLSFMASALAGRLDVFFLARLASLEMVGWYQAAFRLFMPVQQLSSSLSRVLAPRFAAFGDKVKAKVYLRKSLMMSGGLAGAMFLTIPFLRWGIKLVYGPGFSESVTIAYWLIWYFAVFLTATPFWSKLLYFYSNAKLYAILAIVQLGSLLVLLPLGVIKFGAVGAVLALLGVNLTVGIVAAIVVLR